MLSGKLFQNECAGRYPNKLSIVKSGVVFHFILALKMDAISTGSVDM